ncbi:LuxS/MPP-like metallohydrolase [Hysterangium stoloniferum]|nr:LuxS/MPP-like metallohydrolase [Hysterangium stoloniferum]
MDTRWQTVSATDGSALLAGSQQYSYYDGPFETSSEDDRKYRLIRLSNGLEAVVVHDALADKSAACLEVAVGHLQDPDDMPGLAHFCEHMLLRGSEAFPAENDFMAFIKSGGGTYNAGTGASSTNYWFSIGPKLLPGALERLGAFLTAPLFAPSATNREINAVDSENKKNVQDDSRRIFQLQASLCVEGHPWRKFGTGNIESLTQTAQKLQKFGSLPDAEVVEGGGGVVGRETRRRLVEWWKDTYCSGRMTLGVIGKESLDDLTKLVVHHFSPIPNRGFEARPKIFDNPWDDSVMGTIVFVKTIKDYQELLLTFPLSYQRPNYLSKPVIFLSHLVGHEGPGSVYAFLKDKGWITSLSAGHSSRGRGVQTFTVRGGLTKEGYIHYEDVLMAIYNYLSLLRASIFPPHLYEEIKLLSEIRFIFRGKSQPHTYVSWLASELAESYPAEWLLNGSSLVREWNEPLVREILNGLTPQRGRVLLMSQEHSHVTSDVLWETEKWYGTEYHVKALEKIFLEKVTFVNKNTSLFLPGPNPFIPTNFEVRKKEIDNPAKWPTLIDDSPISRMWHKVDDQFWVPKAQIMVDIRSPVAYSTPRQAVLTRLVMDLVTDSLAEITYDASLAELGYSLNTSSEGFSISVSGYNDKVLVLLNIVVQKIKTLIVDPKRFGVMKERLERRYKNYHLSQPKVLSQQKALDLLAPVVWSVAEKQMELENISCSDVQTHHGDLLTAFYVESLVNGNLQAEEARNLLGIVHSAFAQKNALFLGHFSRRSFLLPDGSNFVKKELLTDHKEQNSCLHYLCQFGPIVDQGLRATLSLIAHIIQEPCFNQLRTQEQLGYLVGSGMFQNNGSIGLTITIQSLQDPVYLEGRVDAFLASFRKDLDTWTSTEFEAQKEGLIVKKLQKVKNLGEESNEFWSHIRSGYCDFLRRENDVATTREISLESLLQVYDCYLNPASQGRRKLAIYMYSHSVSPATLPADATLVDDEVLFKAGLATTAAPVPVETSFLNSGMSVPSRPRL